MSAIVTRFAPSRPASCTSAARARRCSTGSTPSASAASSCCASRTPTASARPRRRSRRSSTGSPGSGSTGTARRSASSSAPSAIAKSSSSCSPRAAPIAATPARRSSRRCARRRAPRASRCATTGAGATAIPREAPAGVAPVIRLRARQDGETIVDDKVQGKVVFANKELDDLVLLRSDGNPTYMLAVVVDDHDMGVTHIIRGDDHLTNAARQMQIYARARLGRAGDGAYSADPRAGRRQALQAPRRARRRRLSRAWAICRPPCATIWCGSAGARATASSSRPRR